MMACHTVSFPGLWKVEEIRSILLSHIDNTTLCALRLVSSECYEYTNEPLFVRTRMTFTPSAFTRASRLEALSRVGHHIEHLTFAMPHTSSTFLPPLVNPMSGKEVTFLYTPHTTVASVLSRPKYGGDLIGDVLTQQYPPIFHAATNVPAFIRAIKSMPNLRHLTISCPGQDPAQRYRRNAIDYALTSLRIAIEHANAFRLEKLTLDIHPGGLLYIKHMPGFGSTPSAGRRWKQVRKLDITMDSWDFYGSQPGLDHLKILDDYIRSFSTNLEKIRFTWNGLKGPCPLMLYADPLLGNKKTKLFGEVTSAMSPLPAPPPRPNIKFPKLRYMQVRNAIMSAPQVAEFVYEHRHTVREFDFQNVALAKQGTWEQALAPLNRISGSSKWSLPHRRNSEDDQGFRNSLHVDNNNDDFARYVRADNEVIDTLEELRRKSIHLNQLHVNTKRLKRKRKHFSKEHHGRTLFGELPPPPPSSFPQTTHSPPVVPGSTHPAIRPTRIVPSSQFFNPYPPPPPPPRFQNLPSPTTPTPASRFPSLPPLQTEFSDYDSESDDVSLNDSSSTHQPFETLKPSIFDPFKIPTNANSNTDTDISPPRTPDLIYSTSNQSTLTITPTTSNTTPTTSRLSSPIHFHPNAHLQGNQRNLHAENSRQMLSDDADKRTSVLAKARECVLMRLGNQFGGVLRGNASHVEKEKVKKEGNGFWSRFYHGGREERDEDVRDRDADADLAFELTGLCVDDVIGEQGVRWGEADHGKREGNARYKTESVPLMFSRY